MHRCLVRITFLAGSLSLYFLFSSRTLPQRAEQLSDVAVEVREEGVGLLAGDLDAVPYTGEV